DPVTNAILQRTGSENLLPKTLREAATAGDQDVVNGVARQNNDLSTRGGAQMQGSVKKKGVSFLSRIMGSKKKNTIEEEDECESPGGDHRTEGMDAAVFSQPIGFTPTFPAPPKYIRVHTHQKPNRDFNQTFLAQELYGSQSPASSANDVLPPQPAESTTSFVAGPPRGPSRAIWTMKFSNDGRYLAAAGQDAVVRVWQVLSSHADHGQGVRLNAPVFLSQPIHEYHGHTAEVLSLSWSKNNFLLSSSMDKTVRLWHVTRKECLCCFRHPDFVTSIAFHPKDDRFFLAGSLDSKLRLWSIPDKSVAFCAELPDLITAVNFTPDGRMAIAGCLNGLCLFYETENLKYNTQLHVRSTHGRNAKGSKITGIETAMFPPNDPSGEIKILVTSNDSRVRMYNLRDKMLESKFKGNKNNCSQILASFSDDNKYIISGSEDKKVYIWDVESGDTEKKDKRPLEFFTAHPTTVTAALIAPVKTRQLLAQSGDPLYDLCNPPPVTLVSRSNSITSSRRTTAPPSTAGEDHSHDRDSRMTASSGWISRSQHPDGNIIVTADSAGRIKVFRQDCAAGKRRGDSWDTLSTLSKRLSTGIIRKTSLRDHGSPDRIASWRQSIASTHSLENASIRSRASFATDTGSRRRRSTSP
ncbi:WD40-repeat-containing domain protein, partial [Pyronema omphalodes]